MERDNASVGQKASQEEPGAVGALECAHIDMVKDRRKNRPMASCRATALLMQLLKGVVFKSLTRNYIIIFSTKGISFMYE